MSAQAAEIVRIIPAGNRAGGIAVGDCAIEIRSAQTAEKARIIPTGNRADGITVGDCAVIDSAQAAETPGAIPTRLREYLVCSLPAS